MLVGAIKNINETLKQNAARAININLSVRNWLIGYYIVAFEQKGEDRAHYGEFLLKRLADNLTTAGMPGMNERELRRYRLFYTVYPQIGSFLTGFLENNSIRGLLSAELQLIPIRGTLFPESSEQFPSVPVEKIMTRLSFSHLSELMEVADPLKRVFYEMECIKGNWSVRELKRQSTGRIRHSRNERKGICLEIPGRITSERGTGSLPQTRTQEILNYACRPKTTETSDDIFHHGMSSPFTTTISSLRDDSNTHFRLPK